MIGTQFSPQEGARPIYGAVRVMAIVKERVYNVFSCYICDYTVTIFSLLKNQLWVVKYYSTKKTTRKEMNFMKKG